jgi:LmbE family N-acetylglucosaminyl deacetylase
VDAFKNRLTEDLKLIIKVSHPDLIITNDESGGYGHPDHIVVSKIITKLIKTEFSKTYLWYTSTPQKLFNQLSLPEQMAKDKNYKSDRKFPDFKIWIGLSGLINKIRVVYAYQSQFASFKKSISFRIIPLWFYISLTPFEYFHEVNRQGTSLGL